MERNEHLEADGNVDSPLFWMHHTLMRSIQAAELTEQARRAYRGVSPTVACRAMQAGANALERMADDHWAAFRREAA